MQFGDLYRILDAKKDEILFNLYVSEDKTEAVAFLASAHTSFMKKEIPLRFMGLDDEKIYTFNLNGRDWEKSGAYLKNVGVPTCVRGMGYNKIIKIKAK